MQPYGNIGIHYIIDLSIYLVRPYYLSLYLSSHLSFFQRFLWSSYSSRPELLTNYPLLSETQPIPDLPPKKKTNRLDLGVLLNEIHKNQNNNNINNTNNDTSDQINVNASDLTELTTGEVDEGDEFAKMMY